jgi:hypothetical protein
MFQQLCGRPGRLTAVLLASLAAAAADAGVASVELDTASPPASYAARRLGEALRERGYEVRGGEAPAGAFDVRLGLEPKSLSAEAFASSTRWSRTASTRSACGRCTRSAT